MKTATSPAPRRTARGTRVTILVSEFHPAMARGLVAGASEVLLDAGVAGPAIRVIRVPGAFELPVVAAKIARSKRAPDAVVALGVLIRGQTAQYQVLANAVAQGLSQVSVETGVPVTFGVVVASTLAQAKARSAWPPAKGASVENRGAEAARAAVAVLSLFNSLDSHR